MLRAKCELITEYFELSLKLLTGNKQLCCNEMQFCQFVLWYKWKALS